MRNSIVNLALLAAFVSAAPLPQVQSPSDYVPAYQGPAGVTGAPGGLPEPEPLPQGDNGPWASSFFGADSAYNPEAGVRPNRPGRPDRQQRPEKGMSREDLKNSYLSTYVQPPQTQHALEEEALEEEGPEPEEQVPEEQAPNIKELLPTKGSGPAGIELGRAKGDFSEPKASEEKKESEEIQEELEEAIVEEEVPPGGLQHGSRGPTNFHVYTDENGKRYSSDTLDPETETYIREKMLPKFNGEKRKKEGPVWSVFGP